MLQLQLLKYMATFDWDQGLFKDNTDVWVYCLHEEGKITPVVEDNQCQIRYKKSDSAKIYTIFHKNVRLISQNDFQTFICYLSTINCVLEDNFLGADNLNYHKIICQNILPGYLNSTYVLSSSTPNKTITGHQFIGTRYLVEKYGCLICNSLNTLKSNNKNNKNKSKSKKRKIDDDDVDDSGVDDNDTEDIEILQNFLVLEDRLGIMNWILKHKDEQYKCLGLPPNTSIEIIKKRYRELSIMIHPDKVTCKKEKATLTFQILNETYKNIATKTFH